MDNGSYPSGCIFKNGHNQYTHQVYFNSHPDTQLEMVEKHTTARIGWEMVCVSKLPCSGICSAGYYCPAGSTSPRQYRCNGGNGKSYCPEGSGTPSGVHIGGHSEEDMPNAKYLEIKKKHVIDNRNRDLKTVEDRDIEGNKVYYKQSFSILNQHK